MHAVEVTGAASAHSWFPLLRLHLSVDGADREEPCAEGLSGCLEQWQTGAKTWEIGKQLSIS
eukprot:6186411-Pleurochrysis_carterae.AAC.6